MCFCMDNMSVISSLRVWQCISCIVRYVVPSSVHVVNQLNQYSFCWNFYEHGRAMIVELEWYVLLLSSVWKQCIYLMFLTNLSGSVETQLFHLEMRFLPILGNLINCHSTKQLSRHVKILEITKNIRNSTWVRESGTEHILQNWNQFYLNWEIWIWRTWLNEVRLLDFTSRIFPWSHC